MDLQNLKSPQNMSSGVGEVILIALVEWFDTLEVPYSGTSLITATHTFNADKGFLQIQCAPQKNNLTAKSSGELGLNNRQYQLLSFVSGSYIQQHSLFKALLNKPLIAMVYDQNGQFYYQIGSNDFPCYLKADFASSTTKDGDKGYSLDTSTTNSSVVAYTGDISIFPEEISLTFALMVDDTDYLVDSLDETIDTQ